jgi:ABC-type multidrug transport system ATPase subunit
MAYALAAHALSKRYGDNWALTAIDLQVPFGGITALIGPNGAGKSTLMRLWLAFERPTSGAAYKWHRFLCRPAAPHLYRSRYV